MNTKWQMHMLPPIQEEIRLFYLPVEEVFKIYKHCDARGRSLSS